MAYDFSTLSPHNFEKVARALVGRELGVRFEAYPEGPDSGMDGRHVSSDGTIILQAKHYNRSGFSGLKATMQRERTKIDALQATRYILATSVPLTPKNRADLANIIGSSLQGPGDLFGADDLNDLLTKYQDIEEAHIELWQPSTSVLKAVVTEAVAKAINRPSAVPLSLARLLPGRVDDVEAEAAPRDVLFLLKASPADDEFASWLAPKLEAEGFNVFADVLTLQPGDRWRREINRAIQHRAAKVLLVCRERTLNDPEVLEDIDIAVETGKECGDPRFILPLRLEPHRKVKGIGDAVTIDFVRGWGEGLAALVDALRRQKVPIRKGEVQIDPNWDLFRRRGATPLIDQPERLTSNWLRVSEAPDEILYYEASGAIDPARLKRAHADYRYPVIPHRQGFLTFAGPHEMSEILEDVGRFRVHHAIPIAEFAAHGFHKIGIEKQVASNHLTAMMRRSWEQFCRDKGLIQFQYSNSLGFHASPDLAPIGHRIPWGRQGDRRSSMLRNIAKKHVWQFGVTAEPNLWPFWHFKLKSRVLFAGDNGTVDGQRIDDPKKMHRLRRSICKGWRNKQWHGRLLAFLELLSGDSAYIRLRLSADSDLVLEASPVLFASPVSTDLPDVGDADAEETDLTTLGRPEPDDEDPS